MNWLAPILCQVPKRLLPPDRSKPVEVNGKRYRSMTAAAKALGCSTYKIWRMFNK